jgi:hypothetical protein
MGFWEDRIDQTQKQIIAYEEAIDAILIHGMASFDLDTGQTRQKVTYQNVKEMQGVLDQLYGRLETLEARTGINRSVITVRPGF